MPVDDLMNTISESIKLSTSTGAIFGDPIKIGMKTIIPVARLKMGYGAGGCGKESEDKCGCSGSGGGGGAMLKPVAVVEIKDEETKVIPVVDVTKIVLSFLVYAGITTWMITKIFSKKGE